ncbi:MAG: DUF3575 domain-containing protein [Muribaculaceae bacterium]|nr:DUF3575 domain-containing protein [Muribaculaceae bacterium]
MTHLLFPVLIGIIPHTAPPLLAVKTNVPAWGVTVMNIEGEYLFSRRLSLSLPLYWCPWFISRKFALRTFATQPELRFRFNHGIKGHYLGVHGSLAWFNLQNGDYRYQDVRRPLLGGGISYGYSLVFKKHWIADFSAGIGVASMQYDRFYNVDNGARIDTRRTLYWGIDKISISIGYLIDL